jgi:hypothetical protein
VTAETALTERRCHATICPFEIKTLLNLRLPCAEVNNKALLVLATRSVAPKSRAATFGNGCSSWKQQSTSEKETKETTRKAVGEDLLSSFSSLPSVRSTGRFQVHSRTLPLQSD